MSNHGLFLYGATAKLIQFFGFTVAMGGLITAMFNGWAGLGVMVLGVGLIYWGKSMRFNYQMNSGYIVHSGD